MRCLEVVLQVLDDLAFVFVTLVQNGQRDRPLVHRAATGKGTIVDASLFETGLAWMKGHYVSFLSAGQMPERHRTGSNRVVPFEAFETSTGPIIVAAGNDRLFV